MTTLDTAIRLSARVPVFPCKNNKAPACPKGFKAATQDAAEIVALWKAYPGPLIGIPTGESSGFDVLDIDPRHGGDRWLAESTEALPVTRIHHTRSGGRHILFRHAEGVKNTASFIAPGVDTRGTGGYIIAWQAIGCRVENPDVIENWPRWLLNMLVRSKRRQVALPSPATKAEADTRADIMIRRAYDRVKGAAPGQRHYELRAAAATIGGLERFFVQGISDVERLLVDLAMQAGGENRANAEATARWAMSKGRASPLLRWK